MAEHEVNLGPSVNDAARKKTQINSLKVKKNRSAKKTPSRTLYRSRPISFTPSSRFQKDSSDEDEKEEQDEKDERPLSAHPLFKKRRKSIVKARWRKVLPNGAPKNSSKTKDYTDDLVGLLLHASSPSTREVISALQEALKDKSPSTSSVPEIVVDKVKNEIEDIMKFISKLTLAKPIFYAEDKTSLTCKTEKRKLNTQNVKR